MIIPARMIMNVHIIDWATDHGAVSHKYHLLNKIVEHPSHCRKILHRRHNCQLLGILPPQPALYIDKGKEIEELSMSWCRLFDSESAGRDGVRDADCIACLDCGLLEKWQRQIVIVNSSFYVGELIHCTCIWVRYSKIQFYDGTIGRTRFRGVFNCPAIILISRDAIQIS